MATIWSVIHEDGGSMIYALSLSKTLWFIWKRYRKGLTKDDLLDTIPVWQTTTQLRKTQCSTASTTSSTRSTLKSMSSEASSHATGNHPTSSTELRLCRIGMVTTSTSTLTQTQSWVGSSTDVLFGELTLFPKSFQNSWREHLTNDDNYCIILAWQTTTQPKETRWTNHESQSREIRQSQQLRFQNHELQSREIRQSQRLALWWISSLTLCLFELHT